MWNIVQEIWGALRNNKLRTFLTGFSVAWGIFMLILLLGAGNGLKNGVQSKFSWRAKNAVALWTGKTYLPYKGMPKNRQVSFRPEDVSEFCKLHPEVTRFTAVLDRWGDTLSVGKESMFNLIKAVSPEYPSIRNVEIVAGGGRFINEADMKMARKVAVIHERTAETLFKSKPAIGQQIKAGNIVYKVVGIYTEELMQSSPDVFIPLSTAGKIYFFSPGQFDIKQGDNVIVETARGVEFGRVVSGVKEVAEEDVIQPLKSVIRIATEQDQKVVNKNKQKEKEAFKICLEKIAKHKLDMKLVEAEYTFDNNKLLFYFTADGRIDFRELVKDLAAVFRTRIELRQIGVRDETKIMGGYGICGRELCCHTFLSEFAPVSIKMAKEQNLSLNPTKISGVCGRLMCCLKNEEETYEYLNSRLPNVGDYVTTDDGLKGEVSAVNVLRQLVKVLVEVNDEKELREYQADQLKFKPKRRRDVKLTAEEMKELAALEDRGGKSKIDDAK